MSPDPLDPPPPPDSPPPDGPPTDPPAAPKLTWADFQALCKDRYGANTGTPFWNGTDMILVKADP